MPRPSKSGYARIQQAEEEEDPYENDFDEPQGPPPRLSEDSYFAPIQPGRHDRMPGKTGTSRPAQSPRRPSGHRRARSSSAVDIKAINARLEKWADEIAAKFKIRKIKGKSDQEEKLEIHYSVFQAPEDIRPATAEELAERFSKQDRMTKLQFDDVIELVRIAQEQGIEPKLVTQGSSGSYFAKDSTGKTVGIFKPKDEEPYATKNPKWTKWIHRNLFPFFFGRACLIPNLSYVSEAAAYVLDCRLQTNLVPYTDIVYIASPSFNYDFWDRRAFYRKKKPLPPKPGSFQVFLKGFKDATQFLKQHPWPDQASSSIITPSDARRKRRWADECRLGAVSEDEDEDNENAVPGAESRRRRQFWTPALQQSFREELEKLVILDYIMRNTDRGLDNWMICIDEANEQASIVADLPKDTKIEEPYARKDSMTTLTSNNNSAKSTSKGKAQPIAMLGAIDNSLAWPWKHPDAVCTYYLCCILVANVIVVAKLSIWLAFPSSLAHWAAFQREYSATLHSTTYLEAMVE
jgi:phosphatidylinositol 4-kinase type 2